MYINIYIVRVSIFQFYRETNGNLVKGQGHLYVSKVYIQKVLECKSTCTISI